jgi:hypothetical protein
MLEGWMNGCAFGLMILFVGWLVDFMVFDNSIAWLFYGLMNWLLCSWLVH